MRLTVLLGFLVGVSIAPVWALPLAALTLLTAALAARLPLFPMLLRGAAILPFSATLALAVWAAGDSVRALALLSKSYLSALAAVLFSATTPPHVWTASLRQFGVPPALVSTLEFTHRYLSILASEARIMSTAVRARGGFRFRASLARDGFHAAAGALAVLFARSWQRAESVHRAMLARGQA